jgi:hypothetical protein
MYHHLRLRSKASLEDLLEAFEEHNWKRRLRLAIAATTMAQRAPQGYHSTASSPSLRSKTPVDMERPFTPPDGDGGNVKVVVRVRKFIRRGTQQ